MRVFMARIPTISGERDQGVARPEFDTRERFMIQHDRIERRLPSR
jgi:hypothetical protein